MFVGQHLLLLYGLICQSRNLSMQCGIAIPKHEKRSKQRDEGKRGRQRAEPLRETPVPACSRFQRDHIRRCDGFSIDFCPG